MRNLSTDSSIGLTGGRKQQRVFQIGFKAKTYDESFRSSCSCYNASVGYETGTGLE